MKKRLWIICLLLFFTLTAIILTFILKSKKEVILDMEIVPITQVNYNNYTSDNKLDYKGNIVAWRSRSLFGTKLTLKDKNGGYSVVSGVGEAFQLLENRIVFINNGELVQFSLINKQKQSIAKNVSRFIATENAVYYLVNSTLFQYRWEQTSVEQLKSNIQFFYIYQDCVYIIEHTGQLMRLEENGSWHDLCLLQINSFPFYVMPQGDYVIYRQGNELKYVNIYTATTETVRLAEDDYANNHIHFICGSNRLYVSFEATETNGSMVKKKDHANNGTWCYEHRTNQLYKISNDTFDQLYLFREDLLFGVKDDQLYQIDTESGLSRRIT